VVELTDVSEKRIASVLGIKPFKKDLECRVAKLHQNDGNNIPIDKASHLRQAQILTTTSVITSDVVIEMMVMAGLFRRFVVAESGSVGS
jgi:hypothetical protein